MMEIDLDERESRESRDSRCDDVSMLNTDEFGLAISCTSSRCFLRMLEVSVKPVPGFL